MSSLHGLFLAILLFGFLDTLLHSFLHTNLLVEVTMIGGFMLFSPSCVRGKKHTYPTFSDQKNGSDKKERKNCVVCRLGGASFVHFVCNLFCCNWKLVLQYQTFSVLNLWQEWWLLLLLMMLFLLQMWSSFLAYANGRDMNYGEHTRLQVIF